MSRLQRLEPRSGGRTDKEQNNGPPGGSDSTARPDFMNDDEVNLKMNYITHHTPNILVSSSHTIMIHYYSSQQATLAQRSE